MASHKARLPQVRVLGVSSGVPFGTAEPGDVVTWFVTGFPSSRLFESTMTRSLAWKALDAAALTSDDASLKACLLACE
jgi:hypothetical protein